MRAGRSPPAPGPASRTMARQVRTSTTAPPPTPSPAPPTPSPAADVGSTLLLMSPVGKNRDDRRVNGGMSAHIHGSASSTGCQQLSQQWAEQDGPESFRATAEGSSQQALRRPGAGGSTAAVEEGGSNQAGLLSRGGSRLRYLGAADLWNQRPTQKKFLRELPPGQEPSCRTLMMSFTH